MKNIFLIKSILFVKQNHKRGKTISTATAFLKTNIQQIILFYEKSYVSYANHETHRKGDHLNTTKPNFTPKSPASRCFQIFFRYCVNTFFSKRFVQILSKGPFFIFVKICLNYSSCFSEGSKKRKSNNDDKHEHGQEKRRPSTLC